MKQGVSSLYRHTRRYLEPETAFWPKYGMVICPLVPLRTHRIQPHPGSCVFNADD